MECVGVGPGVVPCGLVSAVQRRRLWSPRPGPADRRARTGAPGRSVFVLAADASALEELRVGLRRGDLASLRSPGRERVDPPQVPRTRRARLSTRPLVRPPGSRGRARRAPDPHRAPARASRCPVSIHYTATDRRPAPARGAPRRHRRALRGAGVHSAKGVDPRGARTAAYHLGQRSRVPSLWPGHHAHLRGLLASDLCASLDDRPVVPPSRCDGVHAVRLLDRHGRDLARAAPRVSRARRRVGRVVAQGPAPASRCADCHRALRACGHAPGDSRFPLWTGLRGFVCLVERHGVSLDAVRRASALVLRTVHRRWALPVPGFQCDAARCDRAGGCGCRVERTLDVANGPRIGVRPRGAEARVPLGFGRNRRARHRSTEDAGEHSGQLVPDVRSTKRQAPDRWSSAVLRSRDDPACVSELYGSTALRRSAERLRREHRRDRSHTLRSHRCDRVPEQP